MRIKFKPRFDAVERKEILSKAQEFLWSKEGETALDYLTSKRALSGEVIRRFELGYIPLSAGDSYPFGGRIIFPLYDASGRLISLSSRRIVENDDGLGHYWHESYEKTFYLYAMHLAKEAMCKWQFAVVVEGQFDALQLHCNGVRNTIALLGTILSDIQLSTIYRYCKKIVLVLDADENLAGQDGCERIIQQSKKSISGYLADDFICAVYLDSGDPDEFVKKHGVEELKSIIHNKLNEV